MREVDAQQVLEGQHRLERQRARQRRAREVEVLELGVDAERGERVGWDDLYVCSQGAS